MTKFLGFVLIAAVLGLLFTGTALEHGIKHAAIAWISATVLAIVLIFGVKLATSA